MNEVVIGDRETRPARIRAALAALKPIEIELIDESHKHVGHAGARDGRGHYALRIVSDVFRGAAPIARHRKVYAVLGELMQTDIHALSMVTLAPGDTPQS